MIKYILKCQNKHEFESWFSNSVEYEKLKKKNLIECIFCKSLDVDKSIMSPNITKNLFPHNSSDSNIKELTKIKKDLKKLKIFVEKNFEFVGDNFPKVVREIYYDNNKKKNIYGTVTLEEKKELVEEGIELDSIPWIQDKEN
jgi:hypothetical protein